MKIIASIEQEKRGDVQTSRGINGIDGKQEKSGGALAGHARLMEMIGEMAGGWRGTRGCGGGCEGAKAMQRHKGESHFHAPPMRV